MKTGFILLWPSRNKAWHKGRYHFRLKEGKGISSKSPKNQTGPDPFFNGKQNNRLESRKDRERHFVIIVGKIHQEDIAIINTDAPNTKALKFIKETLLQLKSHWPSYR